MLLVMPTKDTGERSFCSRLQVWEPEKLPTHSLAFVWRWIAGSFESWFILGHSYSCQWFCHSSVNLWEDYLSISRFLDRGFLKQTCIIGHVEVEVGVHNVALQSPLHGLDFFLELRKYLPSSPCLFVVSCLSVSFNVFFLNNRVALSVNLHNVPVHS